jgi:hypothetical protein
MKSLPLLLSILFPFSLIAKSDSNAFPSKNDLLTLATTLRVDVENIQFLERVIFNSVNAEKRNSFDGYRGYVAAMDDELYMILHTRLKARRQDILVIPCDRVEGISYNNHQVQFKFNRQVLVVRFEELDSVKKAGERHPIFARLLLDGGVSNWHPPRFYDLQGYKKALWVFLQQNHRSSILIQNQIVVDDSLPPMTTAFITMQISGTLQGGPGVINLLSTFHEKATATSRFFDTILSDCKRRS